MLSSKGFDLWADGYDKAVGISDEANSYPFAGYKAVLARIYRTIMERGGKRVLDIGFGTGTLAAKLYENGFDVYGQDFSERMAELAHDKMPSAHLFCHDFSEGLAPELSGITYDFIISTYALHHLTLPGKVALINELCSRLNPGGMLLIGDIAFETADKQAQCRAAAGDEWDDDEIYFTHEEMLRFFPDMTFDQISFCAGIFTIHRL